LNINNSEFYFKILQILRSESPKSSLLSHGDKYKVIRYINTINNKIIKYETDNLQDMYKILLKDFNLI